MNIIHDKMSIDQLKMMKSTVSVMMNYVELMIQDYWWLILIIDEFLLMDEEWWMILIVIRYKWLVINDEWLANEN